MRDEQLREELVAWLRPVQQAPAPDVSVIRRRLRHRRARIAITSAALCALAAGTVALVHVTAAPAPSVIGPGPAALAPCGGMHLRAGWAAAPVVSHAASVDPVPITYLLEFRNTGRTACSLKGWPTFSSAASLVPGPRPPVSYGTVSVSMRGGLASRVVEPTRVVLRRGARAVAAVTVTYPPLRTGCGRPAWSVTPPYSSQSTLLPGPSGGRGVPLICDHSTVVVSPVYPAAVPVTQNYPAKAPRQSPASVSTSPPTAGAGPQAAPYFLAVDGFRPRVAVVHDWRTGRVTAAIRLPGIEQGFAAAGDDRTFVVAVDNGGGERFYQLVLSQQGTLDVPLTPLPMPPMPFAGAPFAVSDDGSELALALAPTNAAEDDEIMVVSLVTGSVHIWRSPDPGSVSGMSWADPGSSPATAWAGNNRLLFGWTDNRAGLAARQRSGLRLLDTTAPGTNLLSSRLLIPASVRVGGLTGLAYPLINSAGTVVFATMGTHARGNPRAAVVEFSATTGRPLGIVTPLVGESGMGTWCGALWVNPSGSHALAACGVQGQISQGRFTPEDLHFPPGNFSHGSNYFAW
jgi:hypothetical protein